MDMDYLSEVEAVAMDMNTSYNALVSEHMPWAQIVYDRYHMQAQFGKDVLGAVRLDEARKHRDNARQLKEDGRERSEIKEEKRLYSEVKRARASQMMKPHPCGRYLMTMPILHCAMQ